MVIELKRLDLDKIAASGQCFRWQKQPDSAYRIPFREKCIYICHIGGDLYEISCDQATFDRYWADYFDMQTDYDMIDSMIDPVGDPYLYKASLDQRGVRILKQDLWEMLVTSIITQNRNIPAIIRSVEKLSAMAGRQLADDRGNAFYTFPGPGDILRLNDEALDSCRLGYRKSYIVKAAQAVISGGLDLEQLRLMSDEACREKLLSLYGVGEKVAACVMLFGMHRLDAFPRDVWIRRVLEERYQNTFSFERYAPYNGVIQQYLFAYIRKESARLR